MQKLKSILMLALWLTSGSLLAQVGQQSVDAKEATILDVERERHTLQILANLAEKVIVSAADARPTDKYGFAPTDGEFKGVRIFGHMCETPVRNQLHSGRGGFGRGATAEAGDELGPEGVRTKAEILNYLKGACF
jgi:hypothetical protein